MNEDPGLRAGIRLEVATIAWMVVEAAVAVGAGIVARSVALTAFGLDSVIELASAAVLLWRLLVQARDGDEERVETAEHRAAWVAGGGLVLVALYVVVAAAFTLIRRAQPEGSLVGVVVSAAALVVMPLLARGKGRVAERIGSLALRADAAETMACGILASITLVGVGLNTAFGWWWADPVAGLVLIPWLLREAREAMAEARE